MKPDGDEIIFKVTDGYGSLSIHKQGSDRSDHRTADSLGRMRLAQALAQSRRNQSETEAKNG